MARYNILIAPKETAVGVVHALNEQFAYIIACKMFPGKCVNVIEVPSPKVELPAIRR